MNIGTAWLFHLPVLTNCTPLSMNGNSSVAGWGELLEESIATEVLP